MKYIHHHLGLGDHIVCNAIVLSLLKKYTDITLAVKEHNYPSVKQLYRDTSIKFHSVKTDDDCLKMYQVLDVIRIGFENCHIPNWEESFYRQMNMDYSERFTGFSISRDLARESALEEKLNLPKKFAFCNSSASTGKNNISFSTNLPIIELETLSDSICDWIGVLEKAEEIHTIDSSIFQLIKQLPVKGKKFFYDIRKVDSSRTIPPFEDSNWKIITC